MDVCGLAGGTLVSERGEHGKGDDGADRGDVEPAGECFTNEIEQIGGRLRGAGYRKRQP
jgi:hypothetical protein